MKILVGINTLTSVDQAVYSNHCQMWFRLGRQTPHTFILNNPRRMSIDNMRNMCAKIAIENDCDYLLFIDDDVLVPFDCVEKLIACDADIAAGWTIIRGYPFKNMFFRWVDPEVKLHLEHFPDEDISAGILECDAVGFSCCLIKVDLLKQIEPPYFITGPFNTEDIYFCIKAREVKKDCRIVVDTTIHTPHNLGAEYIDPLNKHFYKEYYEKTNPTMKNLKEEPADPKKIGNTNLPSYEQIVKQVMFNGEKIAEGVSVD